MTAPEHAVHRIEVPADEAVPGYVRDLEKTADYLDGDQRAVLRRAWAVGAAAHEGQRRRSGEAYITHPVAVARILAEFRVDLRSEEHTSELQSRENLVC